MVGVNAGRAPGLAGGRVTFRDFMPVSVTKIDGKYRVSTPNQTHALGTSRAKAKRQANLLRAIDHGWKPTEKAARESIHASALQIVNGLLEVDEIASVPIPASGKRYARIQGMGGLRRKQQLYINNARDLGNRGKPTHGFKNRPGSAYTAHESFDPPYIGVLTEDFEPSAAQVAWAKRLLSSLSDGAHWIVPATGQIYRVSHQARTLTLVEGDPNDAERWHEMNKILFAAVGYRVLDAPEAPPNPDEMAFAEAMDNAPVSEPLERSKVEKTHMGGGKYGKGVDPKHKTSGKFKFPGNYNVGHAMKS